MGLFPYAIGLSWIAEVFVSVQTPTSTNKEKLSLLIPTARYLLFKEHRISSCFVPSHYRRSTLPLPEIMASLVIFDFDGTLFDTHTSISHCMKLTFDALLPDNAPKETEIQRYISTGAGLSDTFRALQPSAVTNFNEEAEACWTAKYREFYAEHGQPLIRAFPGARDLLEHLRTANIPVAIVSNKGVSAVVTALENNNLLEYIPTDLIIGDKTAGATRKPDTASYEKVLVPILKEKYGIHSIDASQVLEVGDTVADIQFARNIGGKSCWCRYGYGDKVECQNLRPDYIVDSLVDVIPLVAKTQ